MLSTVLIIGVFIGTIIMSVINPQFTEGFRYVMPFFLVLIGGGILFDYLVSKKKEILSYVVGISLIASFSIFLFLNYTKIFLFLLVIGVTLNLIVRIANKGKMPISGVTQDYLKGKKLEKKYILAGKKTRLNFLGDRPLFHKCSIGDILMLVGVYYWIIVDGLLPILF